MLLTCIGRMHSLNLIVSIEFFSQVESHPKNKNGKEINIQILLRFLLIYIFTECSKIFQFIKHRWSFSQNIYKLTFKFCLDFCSKFHVKNKLRIYNCMNFV